MKEVLALEHLLPVETDDKVEVGLAFFNGSLHFVSIHLWIVHDVVPDRECCAGRAANEPVWVVLVEKFAGEFAVGTEREVPWSAVLFHGSEIKGAKSFHVEVAPGFVCAINDRASSIDLSKGDCGSVGSHG